jgi:hypothetical protein
MAQVIERPMDVERAPGGVWAWHWLPDDGMLSRTDPPLRVRTGRSYHVDGEIVFFLHGLHSSTRALDGLQVATGSRLCRVYAHGTIVREEGDRKQASSDRDVLWIADATLVLHRFAVACARAALARMPNPDPRSVAALEVKERWLVGAATDEQLAAASAAAWEATREAARAAAWSALRAVAWAAAWSAPWEAAWEAAWCAAWGTAWLEQARRLEDLCLALAPAEYRLVG